MLKQFMQIMSILLFAWIISPGSVHALESPNVEEIVNRANLAAYYKGDDGRAKVTMTIKDAQGRIRMRRLIMLRRDLAEGGEQKLFAYFEKPTDVRKMVFMVHKKVVDDDHRWLYLPALDLVKRISGSDKRTSFVGSHFVYEDVSGRNIQEDDHELMGTTEEHYVLKNTPKDPSAVEFAYYKTYIDRENYLPKRTEYFDRNGTRYKLIEALEVQDLQGYPTVVKSVARDLLSGGETHIEFEEIRYNIGLKDEIFTERYLRRPPKEVRR